VLKAIKKGDLVRLRSDRSRSLYFVANVIECEVESKLYKLCDSSGKILPASNEMYYKGTAIELVSSVSDS